MNTEHIKDYLWSQVLPEIDNTNLIKDCLLIEDYLKVKLQDKDQWDPKTPYDSFTGRNHKQYNIFTLPSTQLITLHHGIRKTVGPYLDPEETYMLQGWMNVYRENGLIGWHNHWKSRDRTFHGFYCVNTENTPSFTEYKFAHTGDGVTRVDSKDGLLVFGKSDNDVHRSSPGWDSIVPRITIAFDIVPVSSVRAMFGNNFYDSYPLNHFIPI